MPLVGGCSRISFRNGKPLNHNRYLFLDDRSREFYVDWETSARHVVSVLRLIVGRDPSDCALLNLVGELSTHSREFRTWWAGHTVNVHTAGRKRSATPSSATSPWGSKHSRWPQLPTFGSSPIWP